MPQVINIPTLLKIANVSKLSPETLPKILEVMTNNQVTVDPEAAKAIASLIESSSDVAIRAFRAIQSATEEANRSSDELSLKHIGELVRLLQSSGVSDKRMGKLLEQAEKHEHEIRFERTKHNHAQGQTFLKGLLSFVAILLVGKMANSAIETHNKTQKRSLWEK